MQADELSSIQGHFGTILTKIKVNTASASGLLVPEIPANKLIWQHTNKSASFTHNLEIWYKSFEKNNKSQTF